jgi:DNA polymerase-1
MQTFDVTLGSQDAQIFAPTSATFDPAVFRAVFPSGQLYGLDVEGTYMDDLGQWGEGFRVRLVQFATVGYAWVLDLADPAQKQAAAELLADETVSFCSHSNMDVLSVWVAFGIDITDRNVDTLVLANMAYTDRLGDRDLKTLTSELIGPELAAAETDLHRVFHSLWTGKKNATTAEVQKHGWAEVPSSSPEYLRYAGLDAIACRRLVELLVPLTGAPARLLEVECWLAAQANKIQIKGYLVDQRLLEELHGESERIVTEQAARVAKQTIETPLSGCSAWDGWTAKKRAEGLSPLSPMLRPHTRNRKGEDGKALKKESGKGYVTEPCCSGWFAEHGVDWSTWEERGGALTDSGAPSFEKENIKLLLTYELDEAGRTVAEALIERQNYADRLLKTKGVIEHLCPDGRVRPVLKTNGATQTARMSSTGPNMQNFSKKDTRTRGLFIPEPGHVLLSADFDQVELRVVAALAGETRMIDAILRGDDLHQLTADAIKKPRPLGKMTNFLIVYGGGAPALMAQGGVPIEEGREVIRLFKEAYPAISDLAEDMGHYTSSIRTVSGRRLEVGRTPDGGTRSYANINYLVQSSARDLLVEAWYRFAHDYGRGDLVWLPIHDELVLQVPEAEVEQVTKEIEACMTFDFMGVPITASAAVLRDEQGVSRWGK